MDSRVRGNDVIKVLRSCLTRFSTTAKDNINILTAENREKKRGSPRPLRLCVAALDFALSFSVSPVPQGDSDLLAANAAARSYMFSVVINRLPPMP